jgi:hypothetical protein
LRSQRFVNNQFRQELNYVWFALWCSVLLGEFRDGLIFPGGEMRAGVALGCEGNARRRPRLDGGYLT